MLVAPNASTNREGARLGSISPNPCGVIHAHGWLVQVAWRPDSKTGCVSTYWRKMWALSHLTRKLVVEKI